MLQDSKWVSLLSVRYKVFSGRVFQSVKKGTSLELLGDAYRKGESQWNKGGCLLGVLFLKSQTDWL